MAQKKLLYDEKPIQFSRDLARIVGLYEAIALGAIEGCIKDQPSERADKRIFDGRLWHRFSYEEWKKNRFTFWGLSTIRATFTCLSAHGLIDMIGNEGNTIPDSDPFWVTVNYEGVNQWLLSFKAKGDQ